MKTTHRTAAMNATWHRHHPMPPWPTLEQRIAWHEAHVHACGCRPMPVSLVEAARRLRRAAIAAPPLTRRR